MPPTTRRAEIEQARRTTPVQSLRSRLRKDEDEDGAIAAMAKALRKLLGQS